ncbi:hypothetical protein EVAR_55202_1 [Eumeta japonica]|uniref:Uncharacterized protein n=1 Tax=Eumeta variegata TaxID=151549 RepID=A0A4C1Z9I0_EUMVA|nr:hypothetical protein EVAR_55202_1 [Eumeta japonica]
MPPPVDTKYGCACAGQNQHMNAPIYTNRRFEFSRFSASLPHRRPFVADDKIRTRRLVLKNLVRLRPACDNYFNTIAYVTTRRGATAQKRASSARPRRRPRVRQPGRAHRRRHTSGGCPTVAGKLKKKRRGEQN